jgi:hypothetical protein
VSLLSVEIMGIDASTTAPREPVASRDTALACLMQLGLQNGLDPAVATRPRDVPDGDSLSISGLVELAAEFGYRAEDTRVDWEGLQTIGFADPILVLLKNTNVVILTGGGRDGAEEVAVWDPLHRDSEVLFVTRQEFQRAWSGDALRLTRPPSSTPAPPPNLRSVTAKEVPDTGRQQPSPSGQRSSPLMRICLVAVAIAATVGVGWFLFDRTAAEHFGPTSTPVGEASERIAEATQPKAGAALGRSLDQQAMSATSGSAPPSPNVPQSNATDAAPTPSVERVPDDANRMAALPPEPASTGQSPVLEPPLAGPTSAVPLASGEPGSETDPNAATSAPIVPPADTTLSAAEVSVLLTRGDKSFSSGDVASARLFYGRAANAGDGQAALRLGETFDPVFLEHAHLRSARGDLSAALSWYRRARDMGIGEAAVLLDSLEAK